MAGGREFKIVRNPVYKKLLPDDTQESLTLTYDVYQYYPDHGDWKYLWGDLETYEEAEKFVDFYKNYYKEYIL